MRLFQRLENLAVALVILYLSLDVEHAQEWRGPLLKIAGICCCAGTVMAMVEWVCDRRKQR